MTTSRIGLRTGARIGGKDWAGLPCEECGRSYVGCTSLVLTHRGACCSACQDHDTHQPIPIPIEKEREMSIKVPSAPAVARRVKQDTTPDDVAPAYPVGTVIRWNVRYEDTPQTYAYIAIFIGRGVWYTTARFDGAEHFRPRMNTADLMRSLTDAGATDIMVASEWEPVR